MRMNCECCDIEVDTELKGQRRYSRIVYNGRAYIGWKAFAEAEGVSESGSKYRYQQGHCLLASEREIRYGKEVARKDQMALMKAIHRFLYELPAPRQV